jgi:hypothetical protein
MTELSPYPGTPRWVKVTAIIAGVMVLAVAALIHAGFLHGPGMHGDHGDHSSTSDGTDHSGHP